MDSYGFCLEIIGFMDSFNFEKMYSDSSFFNVFGFGGTKIKRIRIRRDIDISQKLGNRFDLFYLCLKLLYSVQEYRT